MCVLRPPTLFLAIAGCLIHCRSVQCQGVAAASGSEEETSALRRLQAMAPERSRAPSSRGQRTPSRSTPQTERYRRQLIDEGTADILSSLRPLSAGDGGAAALMHPPHMDYPWQLAILVTGFVLIWMGFHVIMNGRQSGKFFDDSQAFDAYRSKAMSEQHWGEGSCTLPAFRSLKEEQRFVQTINLELRSKAPLAFLLAVPMLLFEYTDASSFGLVTVAPTHLVLLLVMAIGFAAGAYRHSQEKSPYVEHSVVFGLTIQLVVIVAMNMGLSILKCRIGVDDPEADSRRRMWFWLSAVVLFMSVQTSIRFKVLLPFAILGYSLCTLVGTYHCHCLCRTRETVRQELLENMMFAFSQAFSLLAKYQHEMVVRAVWQKSFQAFVLMKKFSADIDVKDGDPTTAGNFMDRSQVSLNSLIDILDYAIVVAGKATELGERLRQAKHEAKVIKKGMRSYTKIAEESTTDALKVFGNNYATQQQYLNYLEENMNVASSRRTLHNGSRTSTFTHATIKSASSAQRRSLTVRNPVDLVECKDQAMASVLGQRYNFNAYALGRETKNMALIYAAEVAIINSDIAEELDLDIPKFRKFCRNLQARYLDVPYHNEAHAAQVTHAVLWFSTQSRWFNGADTNAVLGLYLAAMGHDVGHIGKNNGFCVKAEHDISLIWNEASVLENMSAATTLACMRGKACFLDGFDKSSSWKQLRQFIIQFILATDIKDHMASVKKIRAWEESFREVEHETSSVFSTLHSSEDAGDDGFEAADCPVMIGELFIKAADVGHGLLEWGPHRESAYRVLIEFFEQGDAERELSLPISPLCDRRGTMSIANGQAFFIDFFALDLLKLIGGLPEEGDLVQVDIEGLRNNAENNKEKWKYEEQVLREENGYRDDFGIEELTLSSSALVMFGNAVERDIFPYPFAKSELQKCKTVSTVENLQSLVAGPEPAPSAGHAARSTWAETSMSPAMSFPHAPREKGEHSGKAARASVSMPGTSVEARSRKSRAVTSL